MKSPVTRRRTHVGALVTTAVLSAGLVAPAVAAAAPAPPAPAVAAELAAFRNTALPFQVRAADLVSRMTRAEKIQQFRAERQHNVGVAPAIPRLGVAAYDYWNEALHGVARAAEDPERKLNQGGEATEFPTGLGIAATWNPELVKRMASATSDEARAMNNFASPGVAAANKGLTYWSPTINMDRDPRWGRAEETYGEDPFLTSAIGGQFVVGMQGEDEKYLKTVATPKHYLANNSENNRHTGSSNVSEAELREYYTPAFAALVGEYGAGSLMTSYNEVNGTPVSASKELVEDLARRTFGFDGTVVSDCDAVRDVWQTSNHNWTPPGFAAPLTAPQAVAWTLKTGVDLDCMDQDYPNHLEQSHAEGNVTEADMDVSLTRTFTIRMRTGEFDPADQVPWRNGDYTIENQVSSPEHLAISQQMSDEAVVLLKNDAPAGAAPALPLTAEDADSVVVVGPLATTEVHGDYSPTRIAENSNALQGIEEAVAASNPGAEVTYISGMNKTGLENKRKPSIGSPVAPAAGQAATPAAVRFLDAAGNELGRVSPETILRSDMFSGWRGVQPWSNPATAYNSMQTLGAWNGWFGADVQVPAGTASVEVRQGSATSTLEGGRFDVRVGSRDGAVAGSVPAAGATAATAYSGPTGAQTLYFVYENDSFQPQLTPEEQQTIRDADAVVTYVGTIAGNNSTTPAIAGNPSDSSEDEDRPDIELPRGQADLVSTVAALNPRTVAWIQSVSTVDIEPFKDSAAAIVWSTYNGMYQGDTVGRVLFGTVNPNGKLPFTQYSDIEQLADARDYVMTPTEGRNGRSYQYFTGDVTYPFGHGLSYSQFEYSNLQIDRKHADPDDTVTATVDVRNTSDVDGAEVVQAYVSSPKAGDATRPDQQLKSFEKVSVPAGETRTVSLEIDGEDLWSWDTAKDRKTWDRGRWTLRVGASSDTSKALTSTFTLGGALKPGIGVVAAVPDGVVLNTATPDNAIHANLSATRDDDSFYDLSKSNVRYESSDPAVAKVDRTGAVRPVGAGVATITATVVAGGDTQSTSFPVVVRNGALVDGDVTLHDHLVSFADSTVAARDARRGVALTAGLTPAAEGVTYTYRLALNEDNTAGATVTPDGRLTATQRGVVRVTVVADLAGAKYSRTATVTVK
ncbi:glycoside hydrolase family 3 C-terminal domain-containing protein [Modestobacter sp. VKM Ac-2986]|uniref:glycoside hydrolase family 3 N-terminal domain-containing protein n=1 Tax=Modestobacter sp. VKM Ac-2986 TaxID=3004140 RepID=UPI0022ABBA37|nr:glycoside hydrolase family 3 N-terminal domain-containing protein [Modestobacter sp. VKM Ac-2986]MCZ2830922.1 glycoside hydrolase family 3 C-terminal domain-containing protein [Modestobacter sp. VKM Ac-2986]